MERESSRVATLAAIQAAALGVVSSWILGLVVMTIGGAPTHLPIIQSISGVIGFFGVALAGKRAAGQLVQRPALVGMSLLCIQCLSLLHGGIDGVHRWVSLAGVLVHPGAILDPILVLATGVLWIRRQAQTATLLIAGRLALVIVQPDAGQATAIAAAATTMALTYGSSRLRRFSLGALATTGAVLAWARPDPLPPVDFVENIAGRAFELHSALGVTAIISLVLLPASAIWRPSQATNDARLRSVLGFALAAYFVGTIGAVVFGAFPTPVLGFGASPVLGAIWGLVLLSHVRRFLRTT